MSDYLFRSKLLGTGPDDQPGWPPEMQYLAAGYPNTIFWSFMDDKKVYHEEWFADSLKVGMLFVNVWFFFVTKNAFPKCFSNLINTFKSGEKGI